MLNPNRRCGTGDVFAVFFGGLLFYVLVAMLLLIESYFLHKKREIEKRNTNIGIAVVPILSLFIIGWVVMVINEY